MLKQGTRLVLLGVAGGCAALVALFLFRSGENGASLTPQAIARSPSAGTRSPAPSPPMSTAAVGAGPEPERLPSAVATDVPAHRVALETDDDRTAVALHERAAGGTHAAEGVSDAPASGGSQTSVGHDRSVPSCWVTISNLPELYYDVARDERVVWNGASSARFFAFDDRAQHGLLQQTVSAHAFAGKRLEFSAFLKIDSATLGVKVWLIAVDSGGTIVAESGTDWLSGTLDWHPQAVVADIPADAAAITLAFRVLGSGTLWVDDARVATVARDGTTAAAGAVTRNGGVLPNPKSALPLAPQNLDFEAWDGEAACDGPPAD